MPKSNGPIGYIEHRSPMKDETGEYLIHPQFVTKDVYDFKDMKAGMRNHNQMTPSQFVAAVNAIEEEMLYALSHGMEVKIGDMFIVRPKLAVRKRRDEQGNEYRKAYHEGDRIPSNDVEFAGLEIRPTKALNKKFLAYHCEGFSRLEWKVKMPAKEASQELLDITNYCKEHGFITVSDFQKLHGVSNHHARQVLEGYCEGEFPKMTKEKVGRTFVYRRIGV